MQQQLPTRTVHQSNPYHQPADLPLPSRRGKWTYEEEAYAAAIIVAFNSGTLEASPGSTLRACLSERLYCDPMRITKKYSGDSCLGKRIYAPSTEISPVAMEAAMLQLKTVEDNWKNKVRSVELNNQNKALSHYAQYWPNAARQQQQMLPQQQLQQQQLQMMQLQLQQPQPNGGAMTSEQQIQYQQLQMQQQVQLQMQMQPIQQQQQPIQNMGDIGEMRQATDDSSVASESTRQSQSVASATESASTLTSAMGMSPIVGKRSLADVESPARATKQKQKLKLLGGKTDASVEDATALLMMTMGGRR